jgi:hypothetical protein
MSEAMVKQTLLDEALRLGERAGTQASRQMMINRLAIDAIVDALEFMRTGRVDHARTRLDRALLTITRMAKQCQ